MIRRRQRDWFRILRDLMAAGCSMAEVGRQCGGKGTGTVQHWSEGGDPKDADARVVLALYKRHCPEKYRAHMEAWDPDALEFEDRPRLHVKPDHAIRGRPRPRRVAVIRSRPEEQIDFFEIQEAT